LEFYVPRDADALDVGGFQVFAGTNLLHTFSHTNLPTGIGLVVEGSAAVPAADVVAAQVVSSGTLALDPAVGLITVKNTLGQEVLTASYLGLFEPANPPYAGNSINLNPDFHGFGYIPHNRIQGSTLSSSPGYSVNTTPLGPGNAPPKAFEDFATTDQNTPLLAIQVLANDVDPDRLDVLRIVSVQPSGVPGGPGAMTNLSRFGAAVVINVS